MIILRIYVLSREFATICVEREQLTEKLEIGDNHAKILTLEYVAFNKFLFYDLNFNLSQESAMERNRDQYGLLNDEELTLNMLCV